MPKWKNFELECTEYLNKKFGSYAYFTHQGGADSTVPDILVQVNDKSFYIEAKHSPAQCGQFVLLPNIEKSCFEYSSQNATPINRFSQSILDYMNSDFEAFKEAGTAGKKIEMKNGVRIFTSWILSSYQQKGVKFFITNNYMIFPINAFYQYFDVSATYRIKRSGSSSVGERNSLIVLNHIQSCDYGYISHRIENKKLFVNSNRSIDKERFVLDGIEYMFSLRNSEYEIRKLSNTFNANVIFSIELKPDTTGLSDNEFIAILKKANY